MLPLWRMRKEMPKKIEKALLYGTLAFTCYMLRRDIKKVLLVVLKCQKKT